MAQGISGVLTNDNKTVLDQIKNDVLNKRKVKNQTLDKDAFLKILTTQLSTQDPLSPMKDNEFMGQMAQFSALESTNQLVDISDKNLSKTDSLVAEVKLLNENISGLVSNLSKNTTNSDMLTSQTNLNNTNENILNELIKLNKAFEAYGINENTTN
ncbi:flagellar hook capping FlgD N-terminal domain-containing protein [Helicovermis profundi]|uniref:Flagellar hook capping protein n=1 Tax=Helicovermis profundi TaxID=3065157 RepID=A0AAU9EWA4_9FIRM|nr:hypothetical protein HLPR_17060 [Clostridia bacterium S502]